ncbi:hypothetical protein BJV74DRAFT_883643 [Russula compacta]|nr:hypothetical protein BJV74DRAFT_883643 [Russula compacta]
MPGASKTPMSSKYAFPDYSSDQLLEPLPSWHCHKLWAPPEGYSILKDTVHDLDDWELMAELKRYRSSPTRPDLRHPLTYALGIPISAQATPFVTGTGGFFMAKGGDNNKLLLITARHVVLPLKKVPNMEFEHKNASSPRFSVLLSDEAYQN